mgnify:CR=1 FL=1
MLGSNRYPSAWKKTFRASTHWSDCYISDTDWIFFGNVVSVSLDDFWVFEDIHIDFRLSNRVDSPKSAVAQLSGYLESRSAADVLLKYHQSYFIDDSFAVVGLRACSVRLCENPVSGAEHAISYVFGNHDGAISSHDDSAIYPDP